MDKKQLFLKKELETLRDSCCEGEDGTWDCSTAEGRESFGAMVTGVQRIAKLLDIRLDDYKREE